MENSDILNQTYETDTRRPLKELCVKNNKPAEMNDNPDKQIPIDTESSKNSEALSAIFDVEGTSNIDENRENQNPIYPFSTNVNSHQKTEIDEPLSDSHCDPLNVTSTLNDIPGSYTLDNSNKDLNVDVPRNKYITSVLTADDSFINAFNNKLILSPKIDAFAKTEINNINIDSENHSFNEQHRCVINSSESEIVVDDKVNQFRNNVTFSEENSEIPIVENLIEIQEKNSEYNLTKSDLTTVSFEDNSVENSHGDQCNNPDQTTILLDRNLVDAENKIISDLNNSNTTVVSSNESSDVTLSNENIIETENKNVSDLNNSSGSIISSDEKRNTDDEKLLEIGNKSNPDISESNTSVNFSTKEQITDNYKSITAVSNENEYIDTKSDLVINEDCTDSKNEYSGNADTTFDVNNSHIDISKDNLICQEKKEEKLHISPEIDRFCESNNVENIEINSNNITTNISIEESEKNINNNLERASNSFVINQGILHTEEQKVVPIDSSTSAGNNSSITINENFDFTNTLVTEEIQMSTSEPNSEVKEQLTNRISLENSAACTNQMGDIINQDECFEKQLDISNGAVDNKESLEAKARLYKEMTEKYAMMEAEAEKYKIQVNDLKKELKICRQKTVTLETEVADLKRKENELNILLEEKTNTSVNKDDVNEQGVQINRLQASEEALKNEVKELKGLLKQHENTLKDLQRKEVKLADDLSCKTASEIQISRVMEEYEKSISTLVSENEKMKKERDTAQMHLANIEMAFSDVHQKYERCKAIVQGYKDNEESFKQDIAMNRETIVIQEQKYETLKAHAMAQLEKSNQELAAMKKQHEAEVARLTAQLKRYEIKNMSLMESLQQKAKECEQLSAVCDEFIGNV